VFEGGEIIPLPFTGENPSTFSGFIFRLFIRFNKIKRIRLRFLTYNSVEFQNNRLAIGIAVSHADQSEFLKENNVRAESFYGVHAVKVGLGHAGQVTR